MTMSVTQRPGFSFAMRRRTVAPASYQPRVAFTILTTESMTGTSIRTPTTVASAAPELNPNRLIAAATASSKKFEAPISAEGSMQHAIMTSKEAISADARRRLQLLIGKYLG